jgi:iron complex outermembrane receptor protein
MQRQHELALLVPMHWYLGAVVGEVEVHCACRTARLSAAEIRIAGLNPLRQMARLKDQEVYAELTAPLLADLPLVHKLEAEGAFRYADYSSTGSVTAWKIGGNYEPVRGLRLRGVYSKGVRAPQILDLYSGALINRANVIDPCARGGTASNADYCGSQPGVNAAFNPPSPTPVQQITVGNPNLQPEIAHTLTAGIVVQPAFIRGLTLSADYFHIDIKHAITTLDTQTVINQCAASNDPVYCSTVVRDPSTGVIITNNTVPLNAAKQLLKGIDAELNYHTSLANFANGKLGDAINLTIDYTHLIEYQQTPYAGALGIQLKGQPYYPADKASGNFTYSNGGFDLSFTERYIGKVYRVVGTDFSGNTVPAYWYTDAQVRYTINKAYSFYFGVNNLTNKQPPLFPTPYIGTSTGTNTASAVYDIIGRYMYAGVSLKF